jgi:NADH dehydrogenase
MKRVVVIGGGFAGLFALKVLARSGQDLELVLVDPRGGLDFLPLLPDMIGRGLRRRVLHLAHGSLCRQLGVRRFRRAAVKIDPDAPGVIMTEDALEADAVLVATGSTTNFHGNDELANSADTMDDVRCVERFLSRMDQADVENFIVAGGGYTGIEAATHIRRRLRLQGRPGRVVVVEFLPDILHTMPDSFRAYTKTNLSRMDIEFRTEETVREFRDGTVTLQGGESFSRSVLFWSAGVRMVDAVASLDLDENAGRRLRVDECLRVAPRCFAAGDAAGFLWRGTPLRMGVQHSIEAGRCAAENILRTLRGAPAESFRPFDPGYIIPMANKRSCGTILGAPLYGRVPTWLHYFMSVFRTIGGRRRWRLLRDICRGRV